MRANGWTSIREGLLFEGGFYSRVYGSSEMAGSPDWDSSKEIQITDTMINYFVSGFHDDRVARVLQYIAVHCASCTKHTTSVLLAASYSSH